MEMNLLEMWNGMSSLVKTVVIVLTLQAVGTIFVTIDRLFLLLVAGIRGRTFARKAGPLLAAGEHGAALALANRDNRSHLAGVIKTGIETFSAQVKNGQTSEKAAELAGRALSRKGELVSAELFRGMNLLASTGSTAPFVGLLGTVLGILNAFKLVGQHGSGGMGTIGVAIAEALIVTGYGLMVAIPTVLIYNWLSARLSKYEAGLMHAQSELVDALESSDDVRGSGGSTVGASDRAIASPLGRSTPVATTA
jgi:biopolymer transport protein ExbB/TolQ